MNIYKSVVLAGIIAFASLPAMAQEAPIGDLPKYEAPSDGALAAIKARGKLIGGVEAAVPPMEYIDKGEIVGFDIDLSRMFAKSIGVEFEPIDTQWSGVIPSLYAQKFDMIWSAMPITEERLKAVTFSKVYAVDQPVFIVRGDDTAIKGVEDFKDKVLGTQLNSSIEEQTTKLSKDKGLNMDIKLYDHIDAAYLDLSNKNLDLVTTSKNAFVELDKKLPGKYKIIYDLPPNLLMAVATRKQDKDLSAAIDTFIEKIKASGELAALQEKWIGYKMDLPN